MSKRFSTSLPFFVILVLVGAGVVLVGPQLTGYQTASSIYYPLKNMSSALDRNFSLASLVFNGIDAVYDDSVSAAWLNYSFGAPTFISLITCPPGATNTGNPSTETTTNETTGVSVTRTYSEACYFSSYSSSVFRTWLIVGSGFHKLGVNGNVSATGIKTVQVNANCSGALSSGGCGSGAIFRVFTFSKCTATSTSTQLNSFAWRHHGACTPTPSGTTCGKTVTSNSCPGGLTVEKVLVARKKLSSLSEIQSLASVPVGIKWIRVKTT